LDPKSTFEQFDLQQWMGSWTPDLSGLDAGAQVSKPLNAPQRCFQLTVPVFAERGDSDVSEDNRSCREDHVAITVEQVVSADGATQYVGNLTVDDGLPLELVLFRRVVAVSSGHTEESAKQLAYNDCLKFCYYYNRMDPSQDFGMKSDA